MSEVERSQFCQSVLRARQQEGSLPKCRISDDVCVYQPHGPALEAEIVTAGFPCQACDQSDTCFFRSLYRHSNSLMLRFALDPKLA